MVVKRGSGGDALAELVLKTFRLNGRFLEVADDITEGSGLTAARWQALGAVLREPLSVAAAARSCKRRTSPPGGRADEAARIPTDRLNGALRAGI
ncbi:hypothetical protein WMF26_02405 [Sorangium sp. So ce185]|uniref:hypothetical protein n=1 Tax=Sorangium sp. So ce185 TaxID=3133287 RepID=UPI003F5ED5BF